MYSSTKTKKNSSPGQYCQHLACLALYLNHLRGKKVWEQDLPVLPVLRLIWNRGHCFFLLSHVYLFMPLIPSFFPLALLASIYYLYHSAYYWEICSHLSLLFRTYLKFSNQNQTIKNANFVWEVQVHCSSCSAIRCCRVKDVHGVKEIFCAITP